MLPGTESFFKVNLHFSLLFEPKKKVSKRQASETCLCLAILLYGNKNATFVTVHILRVYEFSFV